MKNLLRACLLGATACLGVITDAACQTFPTKPVRFIIAFPPGGGSDSIARILGQKLSEIWRQPVIMDNRGGANGIIATDITAKSPPDGYTMLLGGLGMATNPLIYSKLPFDNFKDLAPISLAATSPSILVVHPSVAAKSVKELIALAKANPRKFDFSSSGIGTGAHLSGELFKLMAGIQNVHVPYKGSGAAVTAVISGEVHMLFSTPPSAVALVKAGKLRALAVTSAKRYPLTPDLPTVAESGLPGYETDQWWGISGTGGTPKSIISAISAALVKASDTAEVKAQLAKAGVDAAASTPEFFAAHLRSEYKKWAKVLPETSKQDFGVN
jgi:tripartite-type tricarboxylate transporter receptor subunit TctC